jgi:hypothetical protein
MRGDRAGDKEQISMLPPPSRFFAPIAEHLFERTWRKPVLHGEAARFQFLSQSR